MLLDADPVHAFMPYPPVKVATAADGPLSGLTLAVKDLYDVAGYRTGCGSPFRLAQAEVATAHAPLVACLLEAGAWFVGKSHTDELAWSLLGMNAHYGTPVNIRAPDRVPGGSSSGSASAVAAGLADIGLGSDTGGSVRAPASFCGLYGIRTTHGRLSLDGCMALAPSFDTAGFFARTPAVFARTAAVLLGEDPVTLPDPPRLIFPADMWARVPAELRTALADGIAAAETAFGPASEALIYEPEPDVLNRHFRALQSAEVLGVHGAWEARYRPPLSAGIPERFAYARALTSAEITVAQQVRDAFRARIRTILGTDGIMIAPVVPGPAPLLKSSADTLEAYRQSAMTLLCVAGLAGLPQVVFPAATLEGAPVGLSLIGPAGTDLQLAAYASAIGAALEERRSA